MNKETKFKNALAYIITFAFSIVVLFAIFMLPFFFDGYDYVDVKKEFVAKSAYDSMWLWANGVWGIVLSIVMLGLFVFGVLMLFVSVLGMLREYDIVAFGETKTFSLLKVNKGMLIIFSVLSVVVLVFSILTVASNHQVSEIGYFGFKIGSGSIVLCAFCVLMTILYIILEIKGKINYANISDQNKVIVVSDGVSTENGEEIVVDSNEQK